LIGEFDKTELIDAIVLSSRAETDITNTAVLTVDNITVAEFTDPFEQ
jgi:hypothetical protein